MTSLSWHSIYAGRRGNPVTDKLDCCPVTIKVSSFIVKTPNTSQSIGETHTMIVYKGTARRILGILTIKKKKKSNTSLELVLNDPPLA